MDMKGTFKQLSDKFEALPTWGKIGVVGGAGLALSWLFRAREMADDEKEWVINYPYPDLEGDMTGTIFDADAGFSGDLGGGGGSLGSSTGSEWDNAFNSSWEDSYNPNPWGNGGGGFGNGGTSLDWGFVPDWGVDPGYSPKADQLINQPVKIEENLISTEATNPSYQLYEAQVKYQNATTQAEREAAVRAGELARKAGATEAGADTYWKQAAAGATMAGAALSGVKSSSQSSLDRALYQAQLNYKNATTDTARAAAAAAGAAARAAGATESGAQAIWKSNATSSRSSGGSSSQTAVKKAAAATTAAGKAISSSSGSSSVSAANRALQKAQAAYGAAKTSTERAAAAAAGAAARAAGATDAGAKAAWKSKK